MGYVYNPVWTVFPWPSELVPNSRKLRYAYAGGKRFVSPITGTTQTQTLPGGRWLLEASFSLLDEAQTRIARLFLTKLRGSAGLFYFPADSTIYPPVAQPESSPTPVSSGPRLATQNLAGKLRTRGWDAAPGELLLSAGEYVSYDDDLYGWRRLHVVVQNAYAASGGLCDLVVEPPVRPGLVVDAPLHVECPSGIFRLASDIEGALTETPDGAQLSIAAVQAARPYINVETPEEE
jgi:hypothetical protein